MLSIFSVSTLLQFQSHYNKLDTQAWFKKLVSKTTPLFLCLSWYLPLSKHYCDVAVWESGTVCTIVFLSTQEAEVRGSFESSSGAWGYPRKQQGLYLKKHIICNIIKLKVTFKNKHTIMEGCKMIIKKNIVWKQSDQCLTFKQESFTQCKILSKNIQC